MGVGDVVWVWVMWCGCGRCGVGVGDVGVGVGDVVRLTLKLPSPKQTFTALSYSVNGGTSRPVWEGGREGGR